jgi:predicted protein tyrosine phosphatase
MAWVISLSCAVTLGIALAVADQKGWLRTSKVLQFLGWFWPF